MDPATSVSTGLLTQYDARDDRVQDLEDALRQDVLRQRRRPHTAAWFSFRFHRNEFGTIAVFPDDASRREHIAAERTRDPGDRPDDLADRPPVDTRLDVFAHKLPADEPERPATKGLLITFGVRHDRDEEAQRFLMDAEAYAADEPGTLAWFALGVENGEYGIFDVFPDSASRRRHLLGHVPRELAKEAFTLLGSLPEMHFVDVVSTTLDPAFSRA